jgi:hypothetical protein
MMMRNFTLDLLTLDAERSGSRARLFVTYVHMLRRARAGVDPSVRLEVFLNHMEQDTASLCFHCGIKAV